MSDQWIFTEKKVTPSFTTQIDVSSGTISTSEEIPPEQETGRLLRQLVIGQNRLISMETRQIQLLETIAETLSAASRQKTAELARWKQENPYLARSCKAAAEKLGQIQTEFIDSLSEEIEENFDILQDGEFVLNEFVDRFGPRFIHLNTILQVLTQLGNAPDITITKKVEND